MNLVYQRGVDDCLRAAVATVLEISYEDTPSYNGPEEQFEAWPAWCDEHGLAMSHYFSHSPACDVWIATVLIQQPHAVVMRSGNLLHDPDPVSIQHPLIEPYASAATVIGTRESVQATTERTRELIASGSPEVWPLPAPLNPALRALRPPAQVPPFLLNI